MKSYYWCKWCRHGLLVDGSDAVHINPVCTVADNWNDLEWIGDGEEGERNLAILKAGGVDHRGKMRRRLSPRVSSAWGRVNPERFFVAQWARENRRRPGLNGGLGLLEVLLSQQEDAEGRPYMISQRDADVASHVIQWLGTNIGQCFLYQVERNIERANQRLAAARTGAVMLEQAMGGRLA
jgi:hypothetical protein